MKEIACQFGDNHYLSGVFTQSEHFSSKQAIVLVSAGLVGMHGPFRLYTQLARTLAAHKFHAFRFDLGGVGFSQPGCSGALLKERTLTEIRSALDYLQNTFHIEQFILCGLCSGAEDSFRYAETDKRISGIVLIDPFAYRTSGFTWRNILFRLNRRLSRMINAAYQPMNYKPIEQEVPSFINYHYMDYSESKKILATLLSRKVWIHFIYTGGMNESFNHKSQLWKMFPELNDELNVTLDYIPWIGHTQMLEEDRNIVVSAIEQRLLNH